MIDLSMVAKIIDAIDKMNEKAAEALASATVEARYCPGGEMVGYHMRAYARYRNAVVWLAQALAATAARGAQQTGI